MLPVDADYRGGLPAVAVVGSLPAIQKRVDVQRQADPNLEHETPLQELFEDQLACADFVVLNKTDLVDAQTQARCRFEQELPRVVKMVPSGQLDPAVIFGFQAAVEAEDERRPAIMTRRRPRARRRD